MTVSELMGERWKPLRAHPEQQRLWDTDARFVVVPAGRRSGKTEFAKRMGVLRALQYTANADGLFMFAAPTRDQAKDLFWKDLKAMVPAEFIVAISETKLSIILINGAEIRVVGVDRPERVEGQPIDGIVLDEYANMKEDVWSAHVRPALSTDGRLGWAWFIGVPEGRNHYWRLAQYAIGDDSGDWAHFTWPSRDILPKSEVDAAQREMDELTFQQEYEGSFLNFSGMAYYSYDPAVHFKERLPYYDNLPLIICFDFNLAPGIAVIAQEQLYQGKRNDTIAPDITAVIGEVYIPRNSNTPAVCRKIVADWGEHQGEIFCYGDPTGGNQGTAKVRGSDWDIIKQELRPTFGDRLHFRVDRNAGPERPRVNSLNTRLKTADGKVHMLIDPRNAKHVGDDFERTTVLEGGSGELDKKSDPEATHMTDALGYYINRRYPMRPSKTKSRSI